MQSGIGATSVAQKLATRVPQYEKPVSDPSRFTSITGWFAQLGVSPPIPGASAGMPGNASPAASGRCVTSRRIASAGTCPSTA